MSLRTSGAETFVLCPAVWGTDSRGDRKWLPPADSSPRLPVRGRAFASSGRAGASVAFTNNVQGQENTTRTLIHIPGETLPCNHTALVYGWIEWRDRRWYPDGEPRVYRNGSATRHIALYIDTVQRNP